MNIPEIGTRIWVSIVKPGYIVRTDDGREMPVQRITEGYNTITIDDGNCRAIKVEYATRVEVLGYFNPDPINELREPQEWWFATI